MTTQTENTDLNKKKRMSPDVAELLHMLSSLEGRPSDQPNKTTTR